MNRTTSARLLFGTTLCIAALLIASSARTLRPERREAHRTPPGSEIAARVFQLHRLSLRDSIVRLARAQVGTRYVLGGASPARGFDCSGLVRYVYSAVYWTPPRTARQQARAGAPVRRASLLPGDLLTFGEDGTVSHVGIYLGNGLFVHASSVAGHVIVSPLNRPPADAIRPLSGARRLLAVALPATPAAGGR